MSASKKSDLFLDVIQTHKGILYKIANSYCKESEDRKDLIQEIIIQLWKSFDNYNHKYEYSTWIYKISLNVAISFYRKESKRLNNINLNSDGILF
ncbi:RNA polymerase sigma factor [Sphingobacterium lactis]|uniref:RNA polymerase sigma factor n=1 Tax=Sphingobacterium lactis TaxID=797291 RepID=UPI003F7EA110